MRVDPRFAGLLLAMALSSSAHAQSFTFTPAGGAPAAAGGAIAHPASLATAIPAPTTPGAPAPIVAAPADAASAASLAAMLASMSARAPTVSMLSELQRHEREAVVAERLAKLKAATAPPPPPEAAAAAVKVIKPKIREPLVAPETPLKRV